MNINVSHMHLSLKLFVIDYFLIQFHYWRSDLLHDELRNLSKEYLQYNTKGRDTADMLQNFAIILSMLQWYKFSVDCTSSQHVGALSIFSNKSKAY